MAEVEPIYNKMSTVVQEIIEKFIKEKGIFGLNFPTLEDFDKTVPEPFYNKCWGLSDKSVLGYRGHKDDILDFDDKLYEYLVAMEGVNLYILSYDEAKRTYQFSFVKVRNYHEIGTKHGMLLHQIAKKYPSSKLMMAGEVVYNPSESKLTWNYISGTITATLYAKLLKENIINNYDKREKFAYIKIATEHGITGFKPIYGNMYPQKNYPEFFLAKAVFEFLSKHVFPSALPDYKHEFVMGQSNFIMDDPRLHAPLNDYAPSLCDGQYIKENMYLFDDRETCETFIKDTENDGEDVLKFCPTATKKSKKLRT